MNTFLQNEGVMASSKVSKLSSMDYNNLLREVARPNSVIASAAPAVVRSSVKKRKASVSPDLEILSQINNSKKAALKNKQLNRSINLRNRPLTSMQTSQERQALQLLPTDEQVLYKIKESRRKLMHKKRPELYNEGAAEKKGAAGRADQE